MTIAYFQPRAVHGTDVPGKNWYAIHEVYFRQDGTVETMTTDALSPRFTAMSELKGWILSCLEAGMTTVASGERGYEYTAEDLQWWLECIGLPIIEFNAI